MSWLWVIAIGIAAAMIWMIYLQIMRVQQELRKIRKLLEFQCSVPSYVEVEQAAGKFFGHVTIFGLLKAIENTIAIDSAERRLDRRRPRRDLTYSALPLARAALAGPFEERVNGKRCVEFADPPPLAP